jgi:hypothetical protein
LVVSEAVARQVVARPLNLVVGRLVVNPKSLLAGGQRTLDPARLDSIRQFLNSGGALKDLEAAEKLIVNTKGVILQGHHRAPTGQYYSVAYHGVINFTRQ